MSNFDKTVYENLKGYVLTKKKNRYSYKSIVAMRNLPVKKVIAEALVIDGHCELEVI